MADSRTKHCDFQVRSGLTNRACDKTISDNLSTELAVEPFVYSVDLCEEHRERMMNLLDPFLAVARKSNGRFGKLDDRGRRILRSRGGQTFTQRDIREWLVEHGEMERSDKGGRIPNAVVERFLSIH